MTETAPFRILITGSRNWSSTQSVFDALEAVVKENSELPYIIVHGGAHGADMFADYSASVLRGLGYNVGVEEHPARWQILGRAAGVLRNQHMVDLGADVCLSFNRGNSSGTRHCTQAAERAGIPVRYFTEDA